MKVSRGGRPGLSVLMSLKPVLNWANVSRFLREPSWKYSAKLVGS